MNENQFNILKKFALMQEKNSGTQISYNKDILLTFCEENSEEWWNYALIDKEISFENLKIIEKNFTKNNRIPSFYLLNNEKNNTLVDFLKNNEYELTAQDSWLSWNSNLPKISGDDVIEIKDDSDFEIWLKTYLDSYPENDPKNPYGEQSEFANVLKKSWNNKKVKNNKKYFLAYKDNLPVATAILTSFEDLGYISEVGSIPSVRGEGYGKLISLYCVQNSINQKNKYHFLATEDGFYLYKFYKKIGFTPEFVAHLYSKKNI